LSSKQRKKPALPPVLAEKEFWSRFEILLGALILLGVILASVILIRMMHDRPAFPIGESYYDLRIVRSISDNPMLKEDVLQGRPYFFNPYHYLLFIVSSIFHDTTYFLFIPTVLGLLTAFLFFRLLYKAGLSGRKTFYSLLAIAFTPAFIILFSALNSAGFTLFLSFLSLNLLLSRKKSFVFIILGLLSLSLLASASLVGLALTLVGITVLSLLTGNRQELTLVAWIFGAAEVIILSLFTSYLSSPAAQLGFHALDIRQVFSVFGAAMGFDLFLILIFFTGLSISWSNKGKRLYHLASLIFVVIAMFNSQARIFASFLIAPYCAEAVIYLHRKKWDLQIVKAGTLILLVCALVFSAVNQINILANAEPGPALREALLSMKNSDQGIVVTDENYGFMVEFFSGRKVLLDANSFIYPDYSSLSREQESLFDAAYLPEAEPLIIRHNVLYFLITPEMKQALWDSKEEKLWLLLGHSSSFDNKYFDQGYEVWQYTPESP
jgi:hypothetical protein